MVLVVRVLDSQLNGPWFKPRGALGPDASPYLLTGEGSALSLCVTALSNEGVRLAG